MAVHPEILGTGPQMGQIPGHCPHVFGDGHLVVVQNDHQVVQGGNVVHSFVDHAAGESAVSDDGHHPARLALELFGPGHADGQGKRRIAVARDEGIVDALPGIRKAGNPIQLPQMGKAGLTAGEKLMGIALMTYIKDNFVLGRVERPMQGHRQLNGAEV